MRGGRSPLLGLILVFRAYTHTIRIALHHSLIMGISISHSIVSSLVFFSFALVVHLHLVKRYTAYIILVISRLVFESFCMAFVFAIWIWS